MSSSRTLNFNRRKKFNINHCDSLKYLTAIAYTLCQATFTMITDRHIEKNGKGVEKVQLLYIDAGEKLCDGCDEMKKCASIKDVSGNVMVICKDCLTEIVEHF